jgi:hypothetical protein
MRKKEKNQKTENRMFEKRTKVRWKERKYARRIVK